MISKNKVLSAKTNVDLHTSVADFLPRQASFDVDNKSRKSVDFAGRFTHTLLISIITRSLKLHIFHNKSKINNTLCVNKKTSFQTYGANECSLD